MKRLVVLVILTAGSCVKAGGDAIDRRTGALTWAGEQKNVASDAAELDEFGVSVSVTADRALVGAYGDDFYRGAAYVFVKSGNSWVEEQKLVASDRVEDDRFGWSVSLAGDRALVGAYNADSARGAAYVFVRNGSSWTEEQKLVASDGAANDNFSYSLSLAGDRALIGAYSNDNVRGAAYVFVRDGAGASAWTEEQKLVASDGADTDQFGWSVALAPDQADRALVGAPVPGNYRGAAYTFVRSGSGASPWTQEQKLGASDGAEFSQFGNSVSLAGDRALVGAYWDSNLRGAAYAFVRSAGATQPWIEAQKLLASDGADGDRFGNAIVLAGDRAVIGAFGSAASRGAAYVFAQAGGPTQPWSEEQELVASDGVAPDLFGWSVGLAADQAMVGANYTDQLRGAAYAYWLGIANGAACSADPDCASGHCIDSLCCNIDCTGACGACSIAEGAAVDGTCTIFPAGAGGNPACGALTCNGVSPACAPCQSDTDCPDARRCAADGTCQPRKMQGEACDEGQGKDCLLPGCRVCQSGFCTDGVCCDASCDGLCQACTAKVKGAGADGYCGPIAAGTDPEDECNDSGIAT